MQSGARWWLEVGSVLLLAGCAGTVPPATAADPLRVDRAPPPPGAKALAGLRATDGHGCGLFGTLGTYEGASAKLRDQARALGADYVQITEVKEPHAERECVEKEYTLLGVAYRSTPVPAPAVASAATPVAPAPSSASSACPAGRVLEFSVRSSGGARFGVWLDEAAGAAPSGLELRYDSRTHELALVRYPEEKTVSVADDPVELGAEWHAFRIERAADRVRVALDGKLVLLHTAAAADSSATFGLDADGFEVRGLRPGCVTGANQTP
jgi:hypothetical protein